GLPENRRAVVSGSFSRALAAADPDGATDILLTHLLAAPTDNESLIALYDAADNDQQRLALVDRLATAHPLHTSRFVRYLIADAGSANTVAALLLAQPPDESPAHQLVLAEVLDAAARPRDALDALNAITSDDNAIDAAATAARAGILFRLGRSEDARTALTTSPDDAEHLVAAAAGWESMLDAGRAWRVATDALTRLAPADLDLRAEAHRRAGANARRLHHTDEAIQQNEAAALLTPWAEEPLIGLFSIYAESGDRPDEAQRIDIIRRAREAVPDGRVIQSFRIREAVSRRQFDIAERLLLQLLRTSPHDLEAVATLRQIWLTAGDADVAEQWLRDQHQRFPAESVYVIELANVLLDNKQETDAVTLLDGWMKSFPGSPDVSRRLEQVLRDPLRNTERADELAWKRIEMLPPGPDVLLEKIQLFAGSGRFTEARRLLDTVDADSADDNTIARLGTIVMESARKVTMGVGDSRLEILDFCMATLERFPQLPLNAHLVTVVLACRAGVPIEEIVQAVDRLERFDTESLGRPLGEAINELANAGRAHDALTLAAIVARERDFGSEFTIRWMLLALSDGTRDDVDDVLRAIESRTTLEQFFRDSGTVFARADYDPADLVLNVAQRFNAPADDQRAIDL
ncbi:MAG: hypothetical protein KDA21_12040, partial [Phycisphaerales bacterium]|nr:hypothetical protein [Phycisphaerales bacterium]